MLILFSILDGSVTFAFQAGISIDIVVLAERLSLTIKISNDLKQTSSSPDRYLEGLLGNLDSNVLNDLQDENNVDFKLEDVIEVCKYNMISMW